MNKKDWLVGGSFFCLIAGNYLLQSVREGLTFYIERNVLLECYTGVASLVFSLLFSLFKLDKRIRETNIVLSILFAHFSIVMLFALYFSAYQKPTSLACIVFFVASTMGNVLSSSFLWGLQGRNNNSKDRLVFYSACSNCGQLFGSFAGWLILDLYAMDKVHVLNLIAMFLFASGMCLHLTAQQPQLLQVDVSTETRSSQRTTVKRVGLYMFTLFAFQLVNSMSQTLVGIRRRGVLAGMNQTAHERTVLSAQMNALSAIAILTVQSSGVVMLISNRVALLAGPILIGAGLLLQREDSIGAVSLLVVLTRVIVFALGKPARESMFGVLTDHDRLRIKPVIDGFCRDVGQIAAGAYYHKFGDSAFPQLVQIGAFTIATYALTETWEMKPKQD